MKKQTWKAAVSAAAIAASAVISTFAAPTPENTPDYFVEWVQPSNNNGRFNLAMFESYSGLKTRWEHGGDMPDHMDAAYYCDFKFEVEASSSGTMTGKWTRWNGTSQTATKSYGTLNTGLSMYLFATHYNDGSSGDQAYQKFLGRLYYCKIWQIPDGGSDYALVRNLKPCVKDGVACLYDEENEALLYPVGNALTAGPAKEDGLAATQMVGSIEHPATQWGRIGYAERGGMGNSGWMHLQLDDYTVRGVGDIANLNGNGTSWQGSNLKWSQVRFDGWFQVSSDKAGTWAINQKFDDYFALFIDGKNVLCNNSFGSEANSTVEMTEGWHRFTIIAGDTYGGYGSNKNYGSGLGTIPFTVTVGGTAYAFNNTNFPQGSGTNVVKLNANTDWQSLGPLLLNSGTVLDLNGHQLAVKDIYSDDFLGVCITNSAVGKAVLVFTGTPADSIAYKSGLVREAGTKILFAKYGESSASWTGNGNDGGNALNPNNWQDTLTEEPVLPTAAHAVSIVGSNVNLQIPSGSTFTCKSFEIGNCTFTTECDWRGLSVKPTISGTANLNGHVLTLNDLSAVSDGTFSGGEGSFVEFVVDESATIANLYEHTYIENVGNLAFSGSANIRLRKKDGNGTLTVTRLELGNQRNVDMVQTNGTVSLGGAVNAIGENSGKTAKYTMSGGSLNVAGGSEFIVGSYGTGVFNQSGGAVTLNNWFSLGRHGGNGTYNMTGGSLTANHTGNPLWIGADNGTGTLTIGPGATATFKGGIDNGRNNGANSKGYLNLNGGTLTVSRGDGFNIGRDGTGTLVQNDGTLNVDTSFRLAWGSGNGISGTYTLNDGTANVNADFYLGVGRTATYVQTGGTMNANNGVTLAYGATATATFTLSGGVFNTKFFRKGSGTLNGVTFDGGTIVAKNVTDGANFITGLNNVKYGQGGLTLDTAGYDVTMATASGANVVASDASTFTKIGNGTLTVAEVPSVGNMVVSNGTLALSASCDNASMLAHRWSFNGNLTDSVTGNTATWAKGSVTYNEGSTAVRLTGTAKDTSYIELGPNKVPSDSATFEFWTTIRTRRAWIKLFSLGRDTSNVICFTLNRDNDSGVSGLDVIGTSLLTGTGTLAANTPYYIAFTFAHNADGSTTMKGLCLNATTKAKVGSFERNVTNWNMFDRIDQRYFSLGHSFWNDWDAIADVDEVRVWAGALSDDALALSAQKGPDATAADIAQIAATTTTLPLKRTLELASGATLNLGGNTLTQPVLKGNGTIATGAGGSLVVSDKIVVNVGEYIEASGTIDLSNAKIELADPENLATAFTFLKPATGQTLTVTGVPTPTNLPKRWKVSVSANGTGRIVKRGFVIIVK